jgi:hypothetical protein
MQLCQRLWEILKSCASTPTTHSAFDTYVKPDTTQLRWQLLAPFNWDDWAG